MLPLLLIQLEFRRHDGSCSISLRPCGVCRAVSESSSSLWRCAVGSALFSHFVFNSLDQFRIADEEAVSSAAASFV